MEFLVFRRTDSALVVVPAMFQPPMACRREGTLTFAAVCDIDLDAFTPDVVNALALDGYACIRGPDWQMLASALALTEETADD